MSKNIFFALGFMIALYTVPFYTYASSVPTLDFVYNTEFRFESLIKDSVSRDGAVLGVSTDDKKKTKVTTKLEKKQTSYFKDLSINPPKDWYLTEDEMDWYITDSDEEADGFVTEINNKEMSAGIAITRFDADDVSIEDFAAEVENVCVVCGYKVINEGSAKVAGQKGRFIEVSNLEDRIKVYFFISGETVYFVQLTTKLDEWKRYQKILEKSASTLKLKK